jgi:hypothetical protein
MIRIGGYVFFPMKLRAFVLTAGLIVLGANAAWAKHNGWDQCKTNLDGQTRHKGSKCTSKSYKFNTVAGCTCPGDKPQATKKCALRCKGGVYDFADCNSKDFKYSCEAP